MEEDTPSDASDAELRNLVVRHVGPLVSTNANFPKYRSGEGENTRSDDDLPPEYFFGTLVPRSDLRLAVWADDGFKIRAGGEVLNDTFGRQASMTSPDISLKVLRGTFPAGKPVSISINYDNEVYTGAGDWDGLTLFTLGGLCDVSDVQAEIYHSGLVASNREVDVEANTRTLFQVDVSPEGADATVAVHGEGATVVGNVPGGVAVDVGQSQVVLKVLDTNNVLLASTTLVPQSYGAGIRLQPAPPPNVRLPVIIQDANKQILAVPYTWGFPLSKIVGSRWAVLHAATANRFESHHSGPLVNRTLPLKATSPIDILELDVICTAEGTPAGNPPPLRPRLAYEVSDRVLSSGETEVGRQEVPGTRASRQAWQLGPGEVTVTYKNNIEVQWSRGNSVENTTAVQNESQEKNSLSAEVGATIKMFNLGVSGEHSQTEIQAIEDTVAITHNYSQSSTQGDGTEIEKKYTLLDGQQLDMQTLAQGTRYDVYAVAWPDANDDGIADGDEVRYTWVGWKNAVPVVAFLPVPIPPLVD